MDKVFRSADGARAPRVRSLADAQQVIDRSRSLFLALHNLANELHTLASIDELYLKAVLMGRSELDIDRMGILLMDSERKWITGTYGTDERGNTTDERSFVAPFPNRDRLLHSSLENRNFVVYRSSRTIYHMEQPVGKGWHAMYALWDGDTPIGFIACDNLLTHRPLGFFQKELFGLFGSSIGSLILRKRYEQGLMEKVNTLNRVVAQVAHEINTPLAAIASSNRTVREQLAAFGLSAPRAIAGLTPAGRDLLVRLVGPLAHGAEPRPARERRNVRRQWEERLEAEGVPDRATLADQLEILGWEASPASWDALGKVPDFRTVLGLACQVADVLRSTVNVDRASSKIGKFVQYLRPAGMASNRGPLPSVDPWDSLQQVVREARTTWVRCPEIRLEGGPGHRVLAPSEELAVVWEHLLKNAVQETPAGEVVVRLRSDPALEVEVEDHGRGIAEEHLGQVFRPFFSTRPDLEGLGLGLAVCKTIVEGLGGTIGFESAPGRTVFRVRLPEAPKNG